MAVDEFLGQVIDEVKRFILLTPSRPLEAACQPKPLPAEADLEVSSDYRKRHWCTAEPRPQNSVLEVAASLPR
jgi:hypothetical protein